MSTRRILIAGQAKSGTTALFYSIKKALPRSTRCLFEPLEYAGIPADQADGVLAKVLIRSEKPSNIQSFENFERKILIVRDPRDTLVSSILYSVFHAERYSDKTSAKQLITTLEKKESAPSQISLREVMESVDNLSPNKPSCLSSFCHNLSLFTEFHRKAVAYHQLRYEDLVAGRLEPTEEYLGIQLARSVEVATHVGRVARTRTSGDWKNWITEEDVRTLQPMLSEAMQRLGYTEDWTPPSITQISPEHCSLYARRLLKERRQSSSPRHRFARRLKRMLTSSLAAK